jgi:AhpC/TSA family protein
VLTGKTAEIDLGVLRLSPYKLLIKGHIERAQASGHWGDYTKHYGEPAPPWHVVDARGVDKHAQLADFKGKWVLAYFWGMGCHHCLSDEMPKLMRFYADHAAQRDRFEILALCMDPDGEMHSIADVDKALQPIVDHAWHKPLPFPVLLDPSFTTWERYGLPAWGILILIDPNGHMVKGDETTLARKLSR